MVSPARRLRKCFFSAIAGAALLSASVAKDTQPTQPGTANQKESPNQSDKNSNSSNPSVKSLHIIGVTPKRVTIGETATARFSAEITGVLPIARSLVEAKELIQHKLLPDLSILLDQELRIPGLLSLADDVDSDFSHAIMTVHGSLLFQISSSDLGPNFSGFTFGQAHTILIQEPHNIIRSEQFAITVQSPVAIQSVVLLGTGAISLIGVMTFMWIRKRSRQIREKRNRASEISSQTKSVGEASRSKNGGSHERPAITLPPVPSDLVVALRKSQAILVLGGDASALAGFPDERELVRILCEHLAETLPASLANALREAVDTSGEGFGTQPGAVSRTMDALVAAVPREMLINELRGIFAGVNPHSDFHEALSLLPWRGVVSLSWDGYAERIFTSTGRNKKREGWSKLTLDGSSETIAVVRSGARLLISPLGDLESPPTLSLSMPEFRRNVTRWNEFQRQIGLLLQTQTFVFIGVGIDMIEQFLQAVGPDVTAEDRRHYALVPARRDNELFMPSLNRFGVSILAVDPDNRVAPAEFAEALSERVREKAASKKGGKSQASDRFSEGRINGLKLTNIGLFDELELSFEAGRLEGPVGWTVIFGPNGCGKSSILRAIGLALAGNDAPNAPGRLLQAGKQEGQIEVRLGTNIIRANLVRNREKVILSTGSATPLQAGLALIIGFPALRGAPSPNPIGPSPLAPKASDPSDILPLVNGEVDKRLGSFKQWLINVLEQAGKSAGKSVAMKSLIDGIVRDVVPGDFIEFAPLDETYVIRVKSRDGTVVPFDDMSQGMASIFNWLGVLAQRLYDFYPDVEKPELGYAIALIDEIDAHLHPDWQRRLVELTKRFFPNVQIIATSHSPLLAGALHGHELCVLERDPETLRVARLSATIETYGMRSEHILTSAVFKLASDRNPDLENRIKRHAELTGKFDLSDEQHTELNRLTADLQNFRYVGATQPLNIPTPSAEEAARLRQAIEEARIAARSGPAGLAS